MRSAAEIAKRYLLTAGFDSIGYGDCNLLHEIATELGMAYEGPATEKKVLDRIDRSHRRLFEKHIICFPERGLGRTRRFTLKGNEKS